MKVILTGITGNLGYEMAIDLFRRGFEVVPIVRSGSRPVFGPDVKISSFIENDLVGGEAINFSGGADCIVHCAGMVSFKDTAEANRKMMSKMISLALNLKIPLYYVSTAFLYRNTSGISFNNKYEEDKAASEEMFLSSGILGAILRPSILTGNSLTGEIRNFSGYYLVIRALLSAVNASASKGLRIRFPRLPGMTNIIPVDQAARGIGDAVQNGRTGTLYVTSPESQKFNWLLEESLEYFNLKDKIDFLDCSFEDFGRMELTAEEKILFQFGKNFAPYWSMDYSFPASICRDNLVNSSYMRKILAYYQKAQNEKSQP